MPNGLRPVGRGDGFDCDGCLLVGFFVNAKVRIDRTAHFGRNCAIGQCVFEDTPVARVGTPTSKATRVGKLFQGLDKAFAPPGAAELCHYCYSRTALRRSVISSLNVSLSSSVSQDSS